MSKVEDFIIFLRIQNFCNILACDKELLGISKNFIVSSTFNGFDALILKRQQVKELHFEYSEHLVAFLYLGIYLFMKHEKKDNI